MVLSGTVVYPRSDLTIEEGPVWRTGFTSGRIMNDRLQWRLNGELSSATLTRPAGLRLYSGILQYQWNKTTRMVLGRQVRWNTLNTVRFDGISMTGDFGGGRAWVVYGGAIPDTELRTDYGDAGGMALGAVLKRPWSHGSQSYQLWAHTRNDEIETFGGASIRRSFGQRIHQLVDLAFNFSQSSLHKVRIRTQISLAKQVSSYVQYRYSSYLTVAPYPWISGTYEPRQAVMVGVNTSLTRRTALNVHYTKRLQEAKSDYLTTEISWSGLALTFQANTQTAYRSQYVRIGYQRRILKTLVAGGTLGYGTYRLLDTESLAVAGLDRPWETASGVTGYLHWNRAGRLSCRLFGQFDRNRYFIQDGRIGLSLVYAL